MSWTDERVDTLKQLWHQGFTASQIADRLGNLSRNAVIGKAHRLGLSGRPSPIKGNNRDDGDGQDAGQASGNDGNGAASPPATADGDGAGVNAAPAGSPAGSPANGKGDGAAAAPANGGQAAEARSSEAEPAPSKAKGGNGNGRQKPAGGASILDLNDRICKWPIGDPRESDFRFCGGPAVPGLPYCAEHAAQAYQSMPRALDEDEESGRDNSSRPRA